LGESAAVPDVHGRVAFNRIDSDRNGYVGRVEAHSIAAVEKRFDAVARNGDGLLNGEAYVLLRAAREGDKFCALNRRRGG
jgi:hypothetical protein